jgi:hypothetical protein
MTASLHHPACRPGTSFTKAVVRRGCAPGAACAAMKPVISTWNKTTGLGFAA